MCRFQAETVREWSPAGPRGWAAGRRRTRLAPQGAVGCGVVSMERTAQGPRGPMGQEPREGRVLPKVTQRRGEARQEARQAPLGSVGEGQGWAQGSCDGGLAKAAPPTLVTLELQVRVGRPVLSAPLSSWPPAGPPLADESSLPKPCTCLPCFLGRLPHPQAPGSSPPPAPPSGRLPRLQSLPGSKPEPPFRAPCKRAPQTPQLRS